MFLKRNLSFWRSLWEWMLRLLSLHESILFCFFRGTVLFALPPSLSVQLRVSSRCGNGRRVREPSKHIWHWVLYRSGTTFIVAIFMIAYHCFAPWDKMNAELRQPGLGHRSFWPNAWEYWPITNAMIRLIPGLSPLKLDPDMTSERAKGSNNSYSLAVTLSWPGPNENCATITASTFCYSFSVT